MRSLAAPPIPRYWLTVGSGPPSLEDPGSEGSIGRTNLHSPWPHGVGECAPFSDEVELLDTIPGVDRRTAEVLIAEIGANLEISFPPIVISPPGPNCSGSEVRVRLAATRSAPPPRKSVSYMQHSYRRSPSCLSSEGALR